MLASIALFLFQDCSGGGMPPPGLPDPPKGTSGLAPPFAASPGTGPLLPKRPPPGDTVPGPASPSTPDARSAPIPAAPGTPGSCGAPHALPSTADREGLELDGWSLWWHHNREAFIDLENNARRPVTGMDRDRARRWIAPVSETLVRTEIVPALLEVLRERPSAALTGTALLALARCQAAPDEPDDIWAILAGHLDDGSAQVSEAAALALGVLGAPQALADLRALVLDAPRGRDLCARGEVPVRTRALAAYAMGLAALRSGNPDARRMTAIELTRVLGMRGAGLQEVRAAALIAIGLAESAGSSQQSAGLFERVLAILEDLREDPEVRAHAPVALARVLCGAPPELRPRAVKALLEIAAQRSRETTELRMGAVIALGLCGDSDEDAEDLRIRKTLAELAREGEQRVRGLALVSLAQVAGRPGSGRGESLAGAADALRLFERRSLSARSGEGAWIALAGGVLGFGLEAAGAPLEPDRLAWLRYLRQESRSLDQTAAAMLAAGLARDRTSADELAELKRLPVDERGHGALALGLLGARGGVPALRECLSAATHQPVLLQESSLALTLLEDRELVPALLARLEECDCALSRTGVLLALGRVGDSRALPALLSTARDGERTSGERMLAIASLGRLVDADRKPWTAPLAIGFNYGSRPACLGAAGAGVLELP